MLLYLISIIIVLNSLLFSFIPFYVYLPHMTDNNCCDGCGHDHETEVEFSEEVQKAISAYVLFVEEYNIPKELSAEELIQARMQTIYEGNGGCEDEDCVEEHDSPITTFMQNLLKILKS